VVTAIAPFHQMDVQLNLFNFAMFNQSLLGTVFGSQPARGSRCRTCSTSSRPGS
jgi:hypothetical protein